MANPENKQIPYESTQKDIRDAIESVATAIGGIAIPSADHVSYDNSGSGLSATDVQNALDEIVSDIPTVNNGTLTIQQNGTSISSFSANTASNVTANIKTPTADKKTATDQFNTANGGLLSKCQINLVPVQSGSGDPYPVGGGKNKLPLTIENLKAWNTSGTWSGNTYTYLNMDFTILTDDANNVIGIEENGTTSSYPSFNVFIGTLNGSYRLCKDNARERVYANGSQVNDGTSDYSFTASGETYEITLFTGAGTINHKIVKPMLVLSTETDYTFAPYSNVRPISGHTEVDLYNVGKNRQVLTVEDIKSVSASGVTWVGNSCVINNVTYTILTNSKNEVVGIKTNGTASGLSQITISKTYVKEGSYTFSSGVTGSNSTYYMRYVVRDSNGTAISIDGSVFIDVYNIELTKALPSNASYVNGYIGVINGVQANNLVFKPMIRLATETDSTFEPYLGHLYQVQIGSTVYGGYVDLVSGVMTVTQKKIILNGTENWDKSGIATISRFILRTIGSLYGVNNKSAICDTFKSIDYDTETTIRDTEIGFLSYSSGMYSDQIAINYSLDPSITKETFKTYLSNNNVEAALPLTTPLTIHLTPQQIETLSGQNNLSTPLSGQSIETNGVEYKELFTFADVKSYVDKKIPDAPTTDGTYTLQAVVSGGVPTYSWV